MQLFINWEQSSLFFHDEELGKSYFTMKMISVAPTSGCLAQLYFKPDF